MAKGENETEKKLTDLIKAKVKKELATVEEKINESNKEQKEIASKIDGKIQIQAQEIDSLKEKLKDYNTFKWVFSSGAFILSALVVIFIFIVPSHKFRQDLNKVDDGALRKIEKMDSIFYVNVKKDVASQLDIFDVLTEQDKIDLQKSINSKIEKRNEIFLKEIEKENNSLMKNVVIINLVGRYTVIICCIIAFVLILKAFAGSKSKDDIFE